MPKYPTFSRLDQHDITPAPGGATPARLERLRLVDDRQHALMTKFGGPPIYCDIAKIVTANDSVQAQVPIPPGVTYLDLGVFMFGKGDLTITSAVDATGTLFRSRGDPQGAEHSEWLWTSGVAASSFGAESGRAVQVASTPVWNWSTVLLTFGITNVTTRFGLLGVVLAPIHMPV